MTAASARAEAHVQVEEGSEPALLQSAVRAFDLYLGLVDAYHLDAAWEQVLDPENPKGRMQAFDLLIAFMHARMQGEIGNEGVVVRVQGDWALVVYQYDTTTTGQTTRVITAAWMIQSEGRWLQCVVAPSAEGFWGPRRADFESLRGWFNSHAREVAERGDVAIDVVDREI